MFLKAKRGISLVLLITLIMTVFPPAQPALAAPAGVDGRILTTDQTGDIVNWVEIARSGNYSLIVRSSFLNIYPQPQYYNDPKWQYLSWNDNSSINYLNSQIYVKINEWFNGTAVSAGDNLPVSARLRKFTMENDARNYLGTASTSSGLSNGFSSPKTTKRGTGNDIAFALSFSESANFISKFNFVRGRMPTTQESNAIARANWEKIKIPEPDYNGGEQARGAWLRSPGDIEKTVGALSIEPNNRGRAFQMFINWYDRNEYGYLYPALWVDQAIFQPDAPTQYTLSYNANGGSGAPGSQTGNANTYLTVSSTAPVRSGFTFWGWATSPSATSPQYYGGSQIYMDSNKTLYAVWSQVTYTLSYHANGGSGAPGNQTGAANTNLTVSSTVPTRTGFTFIGWSTNPSSSSAQYYGGSQIYMNSNITLYAVWSQVTYTLSYNANGGTGAPGSQAVGAYTNAIISSVTPTRQGYTFQGWATSASATSPQYYPGNQIYMDGNKTLYAVWQKNAQTQYTITYNANGGSGAPGPQTANANSYVNLSSTIPVRSGHTFLGWSTSSSATSAQYSAGQQVFISGNLNLYAVWRSNTQTQYTVTYYPNGGTGEQKTEYVYAGNTYTIVSQGYSRTGYAFEGWSTNSNGTGTQYRNNDVITVNGNISLYAKWGAIPEQDIVVCYYKNAEIALELISITYLKTNSKHTIINGITREGYTFTGWNSMRDGSGLSYTVGETITVTEPLYIYAQWKANPPPQYTITYNANGGSGAPDPQTAAAGNINLSSAIPMRAGYEFKGWSENQAGTGTVYSAGQQINLTKNMTLYAVWEQITYTITYNANGGNGAPEPQSAYYGSNTLSNTRPTRSGYDFLGWSTDPAAPEASYSAGGQITVSNNVTLYAIWKQITYTITYNANNGSGAPPAQTVPAGVAYLSSVIPTRNGYVFLGWSTSPTATEPLYPPGGQITVNSNIILYAVWKQIIYTVVYNANGGSGEPGPQTGPIGNINLSGTKPTRQGYSFIGWSESSSATSAQYNAGQQIYLDNNLLLFAVWSQDSYKLYYSANGGAGAPAYQTVLSNENTTISHTVPTRNGYSFLGWSTSSDVDYGQYLAGDQFNIGIGDKTLYAIWSEKLLYTLSYDANGGTGSPIAQTVYQGEKATVSFTVPIRSGYIFKGWAMTQTAMTAMYTGGEQITMNSNITLYAVWMAQSYTITYNANGGTGAPGTQTVNAGSATLSSTKPTRGGFTFLGWSEDQLSTAAQYEAGGQINISGNVTLYAVWSQITYKITYDANGGTGAPGEQTVAPGNAYLSSVIPTRDQYTFLGWATSKTATVAQFGAGAEVNITGNVTMYAVWAQSTYTITYDANGGDGAPPQQTVNAGSATLSETIPTRSGYTFLGWSENQSATTAQYSAGGQIIVSGNTTLYAVWSQRATITITYHANGGIGAPPAQTVFDGDYATLSSDMPTRSGYSFAGWNEDSTAMYIQYERGGQYLFTRNITLYAVWVGTTTHILIYDANGGSYAPPQRVDTGVRTFKLDENPAVRDGFTFLGWAKTPDAKMPFDNGYGTWDYPRGGGPNDWEFTTRTGENGSVFITTIYAVWNKADIVVIHKDKNTGEILREDRYEIAINDKDPRGPYGPYPAAAFDGYSAGVLAAGSDPASGIIDRFTTKTIIYLYPRLLIDTANNEAVVTKTGANLTSTDGKIHVGDRIRYTITAENKAHPITVWADAVLTDTLRDGVTFAGNVTLDGAPLIENTGYEVKNGILTVPLGDIRGGEQKVVTFEVTVNADAYGKDIKNSATVTGKNGEDGEELKEDTEEEGDDYKVVEQSETPEIDEITVGDSTVSGKGETGALIIVEFPNGVTAETVVDGNGNWIIDIPSDVPPLAAGDEVTATQTQESKESSEKATTTVKARPEPVKHMSKTSINLDRTGENRVGDRLEYTITLENKGSTKSLWQITNITDALPAQVDFITGIVIIEGSAPSPGATVDYNAATHTITITNLGDIPGGKDITVTFEVKINEKAYDTEFKNTATVDGEGVEEDGDPTTVVSRSAKPAINDVYEGDDTITGTGRPGAMIEITFPNSNDRGYAQVEEDETWTAIVPPTVELKEGDVIYAVQTEDGLDPSLPAEATVQEKPTRTVHGFVFPIVTDIFGYGEGFLRQHEIVVELRATFNTPAAAELSTIAYVFSADDEIGEFEIDNVPYGQYVLYIKRAGYLVRAMPVTISKGDPETVELRPPAEDTENKEVFTLWWGDCNNDLLIDGLDVAMLIEQLNMDSGNPDYKPACDLNADGRIDGRDSLMLTNNINKNARQYAGAANVDFDI